MRALPFFGLIVSLREIAASLVRFALTVTRKVERRLIRGRKRAVDVVDDVRAGSFECVGGGHAVSTPRGPRSHRGS